jgi:uncharacterized protein YjbI with pentapeptide repeats
MANGEHLARLQQKVEAWNQWRDENREIRPDLGGADLTGAHLARANLAGASLYRANFSAANLHQANLTGAQLVETNLTGVNLVGAQLAGAYLTGARLAGANLREADLTGANLVGAYLIDAGLTEANLFRASLTGAHFRGANLTMAHLREANLTGADLSGARLRSAIFVKTTLKEANLTGCFIYGISAWNVNLVGAQQSDLIITDDTEGEPAITVDNLEVAQFIYLLINNKKIREVIDTITSKAVLILGRFTPERKVVLDAIREEIRKQKLLPMMFDFTPSTSQTTLETISTLAYMARFVIADLTDAKSVLQELQTIVPNNPSVPVQPLLLASQEEPGMFDFIRLFPWVLETYRYHSLDEVLAALEQIIAGVDKARARSGTGRT